MKRPPLNPLWLRLALPAYLLVIFAYFVPGATWSPVSRFNLTRALVERGSFAITPYAASTGDRARVGDEYYSDKAPIPSLLAVPAYAVFYGAAKALGRLPQFKSEGVPGRAPRRVTVNGSFATGLYACTLSTAGLCAAWLGWALFEVLRRRFATDSALLGVMTTSLGTPLLPYAASFFGHTIAAAFLFGAFAIIDGGLVCGRRPAGGLTGESSRIPRWRYFAAGACLALAGGSEYIVALPAALLAVYFVVTAVPVARVGAFTALALGALGPAAIVLFYHSACFGAPWRTAYSYIEHSTFSLGHARGLLGLTYPRLDALWGLSFGSARGLFYVSPVCAVALAGGYFAYKERAEKSVLVAAVTFLTLFLLSASYYQWDGGWATGPRHLVPALGFAGIAVAAAFDKPSLRTLAALTAGISVAIMLLTTAVALESPPDRDAIFEYLVPMVREGRIARVPGASNLGIALGLGPKLSLLPLLGWVAGAGIALAQLWTRGEPEGERGSEP